MSNTQNIRERMQDHLSHFRATCPDTEFVALFLYGSQNYGIATEESDVDTKLIVLPSLDDMVFNRPPMSKTLSLPNGEQCDVKDIRLMFDNYRKQNINYLETLFTPHRILNGNYTWALNALFEAREKIARMDEVRGVKALYGMMQQKYNMLTKSSPATAAAIDKFGYDPKQLVHIDRLNEFFHRFYRRHEPMESALLCECPEFMIEMKHGHYSKDYALGYCKDVLAGDKVLVDEFVATYTPEPNNASEIMDTVLKDIITTKLRGDLTE